MGGGLMQLVAYGAQDIYLTGNPQITFFKVVYRRHTNFSMESIQQAFSGSLALGKKVSCNVSRNGDLLTKVYLELVLEDVISDVETTEPMTLQQIDNNEPVGELITVTNNSLKKYNANDSQMTIDAIKSVDESDTTLNIFVDKNKTKPLNGVINGTISSRTNPLNLDEIEINLRRVGHRIIEYVEVEIGGQTIDKHYGDWMDIWTQLVSNGEEWQKLSTLINGSLPTAGDLKRKIYVPLHFWFCRNPGLALPLIALQYHEVNINIEFKDSLSYTNLTTLKNIVSVKEKNGLESKLVDHKLNTKVINIPTDGMELRVRATMKHDLIVSTGKVYCEYIFLDTDERRRFAQVSHEYLIEQVQFSNTVTLDEGSNEFELRFNHPCKELIWSVQKNGQTGFNYFNGTDATSKDILKSGLLQLNGHDRFSAREGTYFRLVQPYQYHTGGNLQDPTKELGGFYVYSFGLKPEEHQPSGTCNFSRIDNAVLLTDSHSKGVMRVYATNYNVLRIMSGMGGLAYSN